MLEFAYPFSRASQDCELPLSLLGLTDNYHRLIGYKVLWHERDCPAPRVS